MSTITCVKDKSGGSCDGIVAWKLDAHLLFFHLMFELGVTQYSVSAFGSCVEVRLESECVFEAQHRVVVAEENGVDVAQCEVVDVEVT